MTTPPSPPAVGLGAGTLSLCLGLAVALAACARAENPADAGAAVREGIARDVRQQEKVVAERETRRLDAGARARAAAERDIDASNLREAQRAKDFRQATP